MNLDLYLHLRMSLNDNFAVEDCLSDYFEILINSKIKRVPQTKNYHSSERAFFHTFIYCKNNAVLLQLLHVKVYSPVANVSRYKILI